MNFRLLIAAVKPNVTDIIVDAAKAAGATGATIITARGTGVREAKTFFGLSLETQTDVVLFVLFADRVDTVLRAIVDEGKLCEPGAGVAFVLPLEQAAGLESQIEKRLHDEKVQKNADPESH